MIPHGLRAAFEIGEQSPRQTAMHVQRLTAAFALILLAVTWRLWTPQTVFPQVPFLGWARSVPRWADWIGLIVMTASLCAAGVAARSSRISRPALLMFAAIALLMILLNQQRLQAWFYQFVVMAVLLGAAGQRSLPLLRLLVVGIYFHSALSKCDFSFISTHGQFMLEGLLKNFGTSITGWPPIWRRTAAAMLPVGELAVAAGLCIPRVRRWALWASLLMHVCLFLALGPWGHQHKPGVLIWNVFFVLQNVLLFGGIRLSKTESGPSVAGKPSDERPNRLATAVVLLVLVLPFLEPFGLYDHWPGWALYASRPERVRVFIGETTQPNLPPDVKRHANTRRGRWLFLRLDRWSLEAVDAPVYPQDRFLLGAAIAVAEGFELKHEIRVEIDSPADRWTGKRSVRRLEGVDALRKETGRFRLNALPRPLPNWQ